MQISTNALTTTNVWMGLPVLMVSTNLHANVFQDGRRSFVKSVSLIYFLLKNAWMVTIVQIFNL